MCHTGFSLPCFVNVTADSVELNCPAGVLESHNVTNFASFLLW